MTIISPQFPLPFTSLEGQTVRLRPFTAADITSSYIGWLNDPELMRFSNQRFRRHDQVSSEQYLQTFVGTDNLFIAITDKSDGHLMGTMTVYADRHHGTADMGIMVGERGRGAAQEAWTLLCEWLLSPQAGLRKVTVGTVRCNPSMNRLMERCGMQLEAVKRDQHIIDGAPVDTLYYARFA